MQKYLIDKKNRHSHNLILNKRIFFITGLSDRTFNRSLLRDQW